MDLTIDQICDNPANDLVLTNRWNRDLRTMAVSRPESLDYGHFGGHPDISERIGKISLELPDGCLIHLGGTRTLIDPATATILSIIMGTAYALKLAPDPLAEALRAGYSSVITWSTAGKTTDLKTGAGDGWVQGRFGDREPMWLIATIAWLTRR